MVAPVDPNGINKIGSPKDLDFKIESWGFVHGRTSRTRLFILLAVLGAGLVGVIAAFLLVQLGGDNLHAVREGELYRSRQLDGGQVRKVVQDYEIRTVLRLVGTEDSNRESYEEEAAAVAETDAELVVASLPSSRLPYRSELSVLFQALDNLEYPALVHCRHGSDRTGLVSTIWLHDYKAVPIEEARKQLAFFPFGHVSIGSASEMGEFLDMYEDFIADQPDPKPSIQDWVKHHYFHEKEGREERPWHDELVDS